MTQCLKYNTHIHWTNASINYFKYISKYEHFKMSRKQSIVLLILTYLSPQPNNYQDDILLWSIFKQIPDILFLFFILQSPSLKKWVFIHKHVIIIPNKITSNSLISSNIYLHLNSPHPRKYFKNAFYNWFESEFKQGQHITFGCYT